MSPASWSASGSDTLLTERAAGTSREASALSGWSAFQAGSVARAFAYCNDPDTRAIADPHQGATADPLSVDHDIDRPVVRWLQRQQKVRRELPHLAGRQLEASELEQDMQRPVVGFGVRLPRAGHGIGRHAPCPGRSGSRYRIRGKAGPLRAERHRRNKPLADDGNQRIARLAGSIDQHDVVGRQPFNLGRREVGGSDAQAHRDRQIENGVTDPGMPIEPFRKPERIIRGNPQFAAGGNEPIDHKGKKQRQLPIVLGPFDLARI